jgi:hypothetical protein
MKLHQERNKKWIKNIETSNLVPKTTYTAQDLPPQERSNKRNKGIETTHL